MFGRSILNQCEFPYSSPRLDIHSHIGYNRRSPKFESQLLQRQTNWKVYQSDGFQPFVFIAAFVGIGTCIWRLEPMLANSSECKGLYPFSADLLYVGEGVTAVTDGSFVARILFRMKSWRHHQPDPDPPRGVFAPVCSD